MKFWILCDLRFDNARNFRIIFVIIIQILFARYDEILSEIRYFFSFV